MRNLPTWTCTSRGKPLDLLNPKEGDVDFTEIAWALARSCRYNGCIAPPLGIGFGRHRIYSIAEHCVHIARSLSGSAREVQLGGLLHDAAEAYTGDITAPVQGVLWAAAPEARVAYKAMQSRLDAIIAEKAGISPAYLDCDEVRNADLRILIDERRVLLDGGPPFDVEHTHQPLGVTIGCWSVAVAADAWLDLFDRLADPGAA